jgi:hypothetical protein
MLRFNNQAVYRRRMRPRAIARAGTDLQWNRVGSSAETVRDRPVDWPIPPLGGARPFR